MKDNEMYICLNGKKTNYIINPSGYVYHKKTNKILKPTENHKGYFMVGMYIDGKQYFKQIHRLVALHFIPNPDNKPFVNHKDGDKHNNDVRNLEWCTAKENTQHAWRTGLCTPLKGTKNGQSKYSEEQIIAVCEMLVDKKDIKMISKKTGVHEDTIFRILYNDRWSIISDNYSFDENYYRSLKRNTDIDKNMRNNIKKIIKDGVLSPKYICEVIGVEYNDSNRKIVQEIKRKVLEESPTTIENEFNGLYIHINS